MKNHKFRHLPPPQKKKLDSSALAILKYQNSHGILNQTPTGKISISTTNNLACSCVPRWEQVTVLGSPTGSTALDAWDDMRPYMVVSQSGSVGEQALNSLRPRPSLF